MTAATLTTNNAPRINATKVRLRLWASRRRGLPIHPDLAILTSMVLDMQTQGVLHREAMLVYADCLEESGHGYGAAATREEAMAFPTHADLVAMGKMADDGTATHLPPET
jgi:hypothetical protein